MKQAKIRQGKCIEFSDGSITSLSSDSLMIIGNDKEQAEVTVLLEVSEYIRYNEPRYYVNIDNRYDMFFSTLADLVKWINDNNYHYCGTEILD